MKPIFKGFAALTMLAVAQTGSVMAQPPSPGCELSVFWDVNFEGDRLVTKQNQPNLTRFGDWNDEISSIYIHSGIWDFFEHADFAGEMFRLEPGGHNLDPRWNDRISSFRCVQPTPPAN